MTTDIRTDLTTDEADGPDEGPVVDATIGEPTAPAERAVEVRRRAGLALLLGVGASLVAIAYLARAVSGGGGVLDWVLCVALGLVGVVNLAALLDARTPLLVADELGVRLRLGRSWVGLPWGGLDLVEHQPRHSWWRDGLLVLRPRYVQRVLEDLDPAARRTARLNRRLHRAPLAVPLGLATVVVGAEPDLAAALRELAGGRTTVLEQAEDAVASHHLRDPRPALAHLIGELAARLDRRRRDGEDGEDGEESGDRIGDELAEDEQTSEPLASPTPEPARETATAARAEVRREARVDLSELEPMGEETQIWSSLHLLDDDLDDLDDLEDLDDQPLLIDGYAAQPAPEPVIGPQLAAARERLGLDVDQLAERTRVRPHVIESIEVDDFSACGGDFYARGHLRTLARVLGVDVTPLLETYDDRYADAPIDPRRVFEAELAGAGSIRATRGGPNWSVLVAAVMALILCWSIARLLTSGPANLPDQAVLSGSGGPNHAAAPAAKPVPVVLKAAGGGARVVVRNGVGTVVFSGDLAFGQSHTLQVSPPIRVQSTDGAVRVSVAGHDRGAMGPSGSPASASYVVR